MPRERKRERRSGEDRRDEPPFSGRIVYSRGPVIILLEVLTGLTAVIAAIALITSVTSQNEQIQHLQQERRTSLQDNCEFLRKIVLLATPPNKTAQGKAFIARTPLRDCTHYAQTLSSLK